MAVKIRLKRFGRKKKPVYRLVAMESRNSRDGESIEVLGEYDPIAEPVRFEIKDERVKYWLSVGAQPTDTVQRLLGEKGLVEKVKRISKNPGVSRKQLKEQTTDA